MHIEFEVGHCAGKKFVVEKEKGLYEMILMTEG